MSKVIPQTTQYPTLIAHRGNAGEFRENTITALRSAVVLGVKYVEVDVQLTSDRVPVLYHDHRIKLPNTVDPLHLKGEYVEFAEITYEQLKDLQKHLSYPIHHLHDLTAFLLSHPDVKCFVDIKDDGIATHGDAVFDIVRAVVSPVLDRVIAICQHVDSGVVVANVMFANVGWVIPMLTPHYIRMIDIVYHPSTYQGEDSAQFIFCDIEEVRRAVTEHPFEQQYGGLPHNERFIWALYNVNTLDDVLFAQSLNARMIETMQVRNVLAHLEEIKSDSFIARNTHI